MTETNPNIVVKVDVTNPGQFFACCGMLELADRMWPGAEGWFDRSGTEFKITCDGTLAELLDKLSSAKFESSLTDDGLRRLGTLLSAAKSSLTEQDQEDKERLRAMWQCERVHLSAPFDLWLDWWWDEQSGMKVMKTWAAKQFVIEIVRPLLFALSKATWTDATLSNCLETISESSKPPFYFDAANNTQQTPRDYGIAPHAVKTAPKDRPLIELLTFIALQRFRPHRPERSNLICYSIWNTPLAPCAASAAVPGAIALPSEQRFAFRMLYRTEYMKAVLPALRIKEQ